MVWGLRSILGPGADVGFEGLDGSVAASADEFVGDEAEPAFDLVDPAGAGRGEVHVEARVLGQPGVDRRRLVGAVVVTDQVHVQVVGGSSSILARNFLNSTARCRR